MSKLYPYQKEMLRMCKGKKIIMMPRCVGKQIKRRVRVAQVTRIGILDMQVCVPKDWIDVQVIDFSNKENECGTKYGWHIHKEGHEQLNGDPERVQCSSYTDHVHVVLGA